MNALRKLRGLWLLVIVFPIYVWVQLDRAVLGVPNLPMLTYNNRLVANNYDALADTSLSPTVNEIVPALGNYPNVTVISGGNTTVTPDAAPVNAASITAATSTYFKGMLVVNPTTGVVTVTNAHVAGAYTIVVTAFDGDGSTATKSFTLTVNTPTTCSPANFRFSQAIGSPIGAGIEPFSVAVGDFNGDGKQDLAVTNFSSHNVTILLGNGNGGFSPAIGSPVSAVNNPRPVVVGDFNGDGKQDLAVAGRDDTLIILLGNGGGGFSPALVSPINVGSGPDSMMVGDFNGDSKQDLAVVNNNSHNVAILLGNGSGGLNTATGSPISVGTDPYSVAMGDFNGDGKQDLAVTNINSKNVTILLGNGNGTFSPAAGSPVGVGTRIYSIAASDFNGDNHQDLAVTHPDSSNVTILLGNGSGGFSFAPGSPFGGGGGPSSVAVGDFNGDGKQDLVMPNSAILLGDGSGGFSPAPGSPFGGAGTPLSVVVGDFNGDGKQDLATANTSNNVTIMLNNCVRVVRVVNSSAAGSVVNVPVELFSQGDENALGFSLSYDPALLSNPQATLGSDAGTAILNINSSQTGQGRLGVALALPIGQTFAVGTRQILNVTFTVAGAFTATSTTVSFSDQPVVRQVASAGGTPLPTTYTQGTVALTSRIIRAASVSAAAGGSAAVPIELIAQGDEHALGFSLSYDPALLSNPQATLGSDSGSAILNTDSSQIGQGRFGITLALPTGQTFTAGTRLVLLVTFSVASVGSEVTTPISFSDQPLARQVVNTSNAILPTSFATATLTISVKFEADVSPRNAPDQQVTITDWVQVGRFAAGLDAAIAGDEFQRADCAPKSSAGDGAIDLTDWAQAGRYAVGLDALALAGGPTSPPPPFAPFFAEKTLALVQQRTVRAVNASFVRGQLNFLTVEIEAQGNENVIGFSLNYDTNLLTFSSAALGSGANGALLMVNSNQTASGRVGIAIGLPGGQHFSAGVQHAVTINFNVMAGGPTVATQVSFGDQPIPRQVVDVNANLVGATFANATVTILQDGCSYSLSPMNQSFVVSGGMGNITVTAGSGCGWMATSSDSFIMITSGNNGIGNGSVTYTIAANSGSARTGTINIGGQTFTVTQAGIPLQFYPLAHPVRLLDTRVGATGCDAPGAMLQGGASWTQAAAGRTCDGLTIPANASAVTGNVTTVNPLAQGFLTTYPSDATRPVAANTNYLPNQILNNVFTVGLATGNGAFKVFVSSTTNVIVDITGYYAPPESGGLYFHLLPSPVRLLETRPGEPVGCFRPGIPLGAGQEFTQAGNGTCGIPGTALALVGNATTVNPLTQGFLTLFPADATRPLASSGNYTAGQTLNSPFTVGLSPSGHFKVYPVAQTHLVIDVHGYFSAEASDANGAGLLFNPMIPSRLLDTRPGAGACSMPGVPIPASLDTLQQARNACGVPLAAQAIVGNVTTVSPAMNGFLTFWPSNAMRPLVATSNFRAGQNFNRHFTVGLGTDGAFKIYALTSSHLVIDVSGYFAP